MNFGEKRQIVSQSRLQSRQLARHGPPILLVKRQMGEEKKLQPLGRDSKRSNVLTKTSWCSYKGECDDHFEVMSGEKGMEITKY